MHHQPTLPEVSVPEGLNNPARLYQPDTGLGRYDDNGHSANFDRPEAALTRHTARTAGYSAVRAASMGSEPGPQTAGAGAEQAGPPQVSHDVSEALPVDAPPPSAAGGGPKDPKDPTGDKGYGGGDSPEGGDNEPSEGEEPAAKQAPDTERTEAAAEPEPTRDRLEREAEQKYPSTVLPDDPEVIRELKEKDTEVKRTIYVNTEILKDGLITRYGGAVDPDEAASSTLPLSPPESTTYSRKVFDGSEHLPLVEATSGQQPEDTALPEPVVPGPDESAEAAVPAEGLQGPEQPNIPVVGRPGLKPYAHGDPKRDAVQANRDADAWKASMAAAAVPAEPPAAPQRVPGATVPTTERAATQDVGEDGPELTEAEQRAAIQRIVEAASKSEATGTEADPEQVQDETGTEVDPEEVQDDILRRIHRKLKED